MQEVFQLRREFLRTFKILISRVDLDLQLTVSVERHDSSNVGKQAYTKGPYVCGLGKVSFLFDNSALRCCEARGAFAVEEFGVVRYLTSGDRKITQLDFTCSAVEEYVIQLDISVYYVGFLVEIDKCLDQFRKYEAGHLFYFGSLVVC